MAEAESSVVYVQMTQAQGDSRYGKIPAGAILPVDPERADRWIGVGVAEPSSQADYDQYKSAQTEKAQSRQDAFSALNRDSAAAKWDVSTHRDALSAPEAGLRAALEAGVPLVNLGRLRTPDGLPISPDASVEEILEARANQHPELVGPLTAHEQASTSGGGSHYDMPMPLNPEMRQQERTIRENERNAQSEAYKAEQANTSGDTTTASPTIRQQAASRRAAAAPASTEQAAEPKT